MVGVVAITSRAEHRVELGASRREDIAQESSLLGGAPRPVTEHRDLTAIRQLERGDIERVAEGMLGERTEMTSVPAAAPVRGDLPDADHGLAEIAPACLLYWPAGPA